VEVASWLDMGGWGSFLGFPIPCILAYQKCNLLNVRGGPPIALVMFKAKKEDSTFSMHDRIEFRVCVGQPMLLKRWDVKNHLTLDSCVVAS